MKKFEFRLRSLLEFRRSRRDQWRQVLAQILQQDQQLLDSKAAMAANRIVQLEDLRQLGAGGQVDLDGSVSRRFYAGQLSGQMLQIDYDRKTLGEQLARCREELVKADQDVKVLERLEEKQLQSHRHDQERLAQRELEDGWMAINQTGTKSCYGPA